MPHPKRRHSKSRRDKRRTHYKATIVGHTNCPECNALKLPHSACSECGYYNGRKILTNVA
ncbi:MAG: 50S ribosomal protein L32 [Candidatus Kapabacteria bacterium]|jgi:large subunit ribosomal protein L32|nr:50S ribosomal protein L32 [Candidatus Kapabacteria bacterium]